MGLIFSILYAFPNLCGKLRLFITFSFTVKENIGKKPAQTREAIPVWVKFPILNRFSWELWPKPSDSERPVSSSGTHKVWDDDDNNDEFKHIVVTNHDPDVWAEIVSFADL